MQAAKLMTNLLPDYYSFLEKEAKREKKSKRQIIEESIELYMREKRKKELRRAYETMAKDQEYLNEMVEMAEGGMGDFLTTIDDENSKI